jgi:hypothetical protein
MFVWLECNKQLKQAVFGHFAVCCTSQRHPLPSVKAKTLGKVTVSGNSGTGFAEFLGLPSAFALTLGKG